MLARYGSIEGDVPPIMSEDEAFGATDIQCEKRRETPESAASGHAPRSAQSFLSASAQAVRINRKTCLLMDLAAALSKGTPFFCR